MDIGIGEPIFAARERGSQVWGQLQNCRQILWAGLAQLSHFVSDFRNF